MKAKHNKNLSLPRTPQGEKASGNHQILLPREKSYELNFLRILTRSHFLAFLYQFFDLADRAIVTGYITTVINTFTRFYLRVSKSR